jgi:hypothetical protein
VRLVDGGGEGAKFARDVCGRDGAADQEEVLGVVLVRLLARSEVLVGMLPCPGNLWASGTLSSAGFDRGTAASSLRGRGCRGLAGRGSGLMLLSRRRSSGWVLGG